MKIGVNFLVVILLFVAAISVGYLKGRFVNPVDPHVNEYSNKLNHKNDETNG